MFGRSFIRRSSNHNYSFHTERVFTQDWPNIFWIAVACSGLAFMSQGKQSDVFEEECLCRKVFINVIKSLAMLLLHVFFLIPYFIVIDIVVACLCLVVDHVNKLFIGIIVFCCCCMFTFLSDFLYTDVVAIFFYSLIMLRSPLILFLKLLSF